MVHIIAGQKGSGKTKLLVEAIHNALESQSGSVVCIERGSTLRYDIDHRVRLIDATEYPCDSYTFLKGFISGLHAGNFDITNIFVDNLCKISKSKSEEEAEAFLLWLEKFSEENSICITCTVSTETAEIPAVFSKYC